MIQISVLFCSIRVRKERQAALAMILATLMVPFIVRGGIDVAG
jgi:hypothetical protein